MLFLIIKQGSREYQARLPTEAVPSSTYAQSSSPGISAKFPQVAMGQSSYPGGMNRHTVVIPRGRFWDRGRFGSNYSIKLE